MGCYGLVLPIGGSLWGVVTTIFEPTPSIKTYLDFITYGKIVIVGDKKTPDAVWRQFVKQYPGRIIYLGPSDQEALGYAILKLLPWNHFARKNVGYLFAIEQGAKWIYDFDDDNELMQKRGSISLFRHLVRGHHTENSTSKIASYIASVDHHLYNPYPHFNPVDKRTTHPIQGAIWPRGFPLAFIQDKGTVGFLKELEGGVLEIEPTKYKIAIYQSLADHDPDVDAVYRMTQTLPIKWSTENQIVTVPVGTFSPWNAQAVLVKHQAFWGLLLPASVEGRVSDIWRSYITTRILWEIGYVVAFTSPFVVQYRNAHNYQLDLEAESDLYMKTSYLLARLTDFERARGASEEEGVDVMLTRLFALLCEDPYKFVKSSDVLLAQAWVKDLHHVGYEFPKTHPAVRIPTLKVRELKIVDGRQTKKENEDSNPSPTPIVTISNNPVALITAPIPHVLLMGQFNWKPCGGCLRTWVDSWSTFINATNIVAAVPEETADKTFWGGQVYSYSADKGYISPYTNLAHWIRNSLHTSQTAESPHIKGVMYVHDDLMVGPEILSRLGKNKWIWTNTRQLYQFKLLKTGKIINPPATRWSHWDLCSAQFSNLVTDVRLEPFWDAALVGDGSLLGTVGQSDMLYVSLHNATHTAAFLTLLDLFAEHSLFLECAIPTAVSMMRQRFGVITYNGHLCTEWYSSKRSDPATWVSDCPPGSEVFHPIKLSLPAWSNYFKTISTGLIIPTYTT